MGSKCADLTPVAHLTRFVHLLLLLFCHGYCGCLGGLPPLGVTGRCLWLLPCFLAPPLHFHPSPTHPLPYGPSLRVSCSYRPHPSTSFLPFAPAGPSPSHLGSPADPRHLLLFFHWTVSDIGCGWTGPGRQEARRGVSWSLGQLGGGVPILCGGSRGSQSQSSLSHAGAAQLGTPTCYLKGKSKDSGYPECVIGGPSLAAPFPQPILQAGFVT